MWLLYGNLFTNLREGDLTGVPAGDICIAVGSTMIEGIKKGYDTVEAGRLVAVWNSWGLLEVAVNMGSAQQLCKAKIGDRVIVTAAS